MALPTIVLCLIVVAAAAAEEATPENPLREIGRIRANSPCAAIVTRANGVIATALRNDIAVGNTVSLLRKADLDSNVIARRNSMNDLSKLAGDLRAAAVRANGDVQRLRELAAESADQTRRTELKAFADALGDAIGKQKTIALDMQGFVEYLNYVQQRDMPELHQMNKVTMADPSVPFMRWYVETGRDMPLQPITGGTPDTELARRAAKDLEARAQIISGVEAKAAEHTAGIVSGCS